MKKILAIAFAFALVFGFAGCTIFGGGVDYFPVKEGQVWTYTVTSHDSTFMVATDTFTVNDSTWETTTTCVGETTLDDGTKVWEFRTASDTSYMELGKDTVNYFGAKADTAPVMSIPKKLAVGTTWTTPINDTLDMTWTATAAEDVTVPAGTYKGALKISLTTPGVTMDNFQWWDKDAGSVKGYTKSITDISGVMYMLMEVTSELKSMQ